MGVAYRAASSRSSSSTTPRDEPAASAFVERFVAPIPRPVDYHRRRMRKLLIAGSIITAAIAAWSAVNDDGSSSAPNDFVGAERRRDAIEPLGSPESNDETSHKVVAVAPFVDAPDAPLEEENTPTRPEASDYLCIVRRHDGTPACGAWVALSTWTFGSKGSPFERVQADDFGRVPMSSELRRSLHARSAAPHLETIVVAETAGRPAALRPSFRPKEFSPGETPILTLPPVGSLRVDLVDASGAPYRGEAVIRVEEYPTRSWLNERLDDRFPMQLQKFGANSGFGYARTSDGSARLDYVSTVDGFRVIGAPTARGERVGVVRVAAPTPGGDFGVVRVVMPGRSLTAEGRVVDKAGAPRGSARLYLRLEAGGAELARAGGERAEAVVHADKEGRFVATLDLDPADRRATDVRVSLFETMLGGVKIETVVAVGPPDESGRLILGDLVLGAPAKTIRGCVVDEGGLPVPKALIRFLTRVESDSGPSYERLPRAFGEFACSSEDGRFEAKTPAHGDGDSPLYASAERSGYLLLEPAACDADGALVIRLKRSGSIKGSLKDGPSRGAADALRFRVVDSSVPRSESSIAMLFEGGARDVVVGSDGTFRVDGLAAGEASFFIDVYGRAEPLFAIDGIVVEPGGVVEDPRLQKIDISAFVRELRVTVLDPNRNPITDACVATPGNLLTPGVRRRVDAAGTALFPAVDDVRTLVVSAPGRASREIAAPKDSCVVVLEDEVLRRISLVVGNDAPAPPVDCELFARVRRRSAPDGLDAFGAFGVESEELGVVPSEGLVGGASGPFVTLARAPGDYEATLFVRRLSGISRRSAPLSDPRVVAVGREVATVRVEFDYDAADLDRALKELEKD
jgi:hypothetical protein